MSTNTTTNSKFATMRQALVMAHNTNNSKAISKDFAAGASVKLADYNNWVATINSLYDLVTPWASKIIDKKATDQELQEIYNGVFPIWKELVSVDDKGFFVREADAVVICRAAMKYGQSVNGTVAIATSKVSFRREIETFIGLRMAQNAVVSEDDYEIICKFEKAVTTQEKAENRLSGYEKNGKKVAGLHDKLQEAKEIREKMTQLAIQMGADEKTIEDNPIISGYITAVKNFESDIKSAEKTIEKAKETQSKLRKDYNTIMKRIAEIK